MNIQTAGTVGRLAAGVMIVGFVMMSGTTRAQGAPDGPAPGGDVVNVGTYIHVVADLDRTVAFYRTLLGIDPNCRVVSLCGAYSTGTLTSRRVTRCSSRASRAWYCCSARAKNRSL
jgi:hypothetical protein